MACSIVEKTGNAGVGVRQAVDGGNRFTGTSFGFKEFIDYSLKLRLLLIVNEFLLAQVFQLIAKLQNPLLGFLNAGHFADAR